MRACLHQCFSLPGPKESILDFLFHCLSPAHESLASNNPFLIVIESHALSSASPALPSTNDSNCQRLKATTPLSETFPPVASDRYLLSEISPFSCLRSSYTLLSASCLNSALGLALSSFGFLLLVCFQLSAFGAFGQRCIWLRRASYFCVDWRTEFPPQSTPMKLDFLYTYHFL